MLIAMLSQALYVAGRHDEARRCAEQAVGCVFPISQRLAQGVLAMVMAADGEVLEAERLARDAVSFFTESDLVLDHAMALTSLGEVLRLAGRPTDAAATVEQAMDLYVRKGDVVSARRARTLRDQLAAAAQHERAPGHPSGRGRVTSCSWTDGWRGPGGSPAALVTGAGLVEPSHVLEVVRHHIVGIGEHDVMTGSAMELVHGSEDVVAEEVVPWAREEEIAAVSPNS